MPNHFSKEDLQAIDESFDGDFKGVWHIPDGENYLSIDVFDVYKHIEEDEVFFCVWEKRKLLFQGNLNECLTYMHTWL